jgi:hypothetical protein
VTHVPHPALPEAPENGVVPPAVDALSGTAPCWLYLVQGLLAAGCIFLIGLTFAHLFSRAVGLAGASLLALARYHAFYTTFALVEVPQGYWLCLLVPVVLVAVAVSAGVVNFAFEAYRTHLEVDLTTQRDYGRTAWREAGNPPGEWVADLILPFR